MQFIIVANEDLVTLGCQFSHALSAQKTHSAELWTVKLYKKNKNRWGDKQPVIFLGNNEVTKSLVLPVRFGDFGTKYVVSRFLKDELETFVSGIKDGSR
jgi:hypothetical protein